MAATGSEHVRKALVINRARRKEYVTLAMVAALIMVSVALGLHQRGIAATHTERVLDCQYVGNGAHTHDTSCYDADGYLVCPLVEREYHVHDDSCYTETRELACGIEEHTHSDACYDEEGNLTCGLEEHVHTDACYQVTRELTCGKDEVTETHTHGPGCFREVTVDDGEQETQLLGAQTTSVVNVQNAAETIPEEGADAMPAQTFAGELKERDAEGNERVVMTINIKAPEGALPAGTQLAMKAIEGNELEVATAYIEEAVRKADKDAKGINWMQIVDFSFVDASGYEVRPQKKIEIKITHNRIRSIEKPLLARTLDAETKAQFNRDEDAEVLENVAITNLLDEDTSTGNENTFTFKTKVPGTYAVVEAAYEDEAVIVDDTPVEDVNPAESDVPAEVEAPAEDDAVEDESTAEDNAATDDDAAPTEDAEQLEEPAEAVEVEINTMPAQSFSAEVDGITVNVEAPEGAFDEGVQMKAASVEPDMVRAQVEDAVDSDFDQVTDLAAVNISFADAEGNPVEPAEPVSVSLTSDIVLDAEKPVLVQVGDEPTVVEGAEVVNSHSESAAADESSETAETVEAADTVTEESPSESETGAEDTMRFEGEGSGTYVVVAIQTLTSKVITATGDTYVINVTYGPDAGIPAGAELRVSEIAEGEKEYEDAQKTVDERMDQGKEEIPTHPALFDISIWYDGKEIEPAEGSEVKVEVTLVGGSLKGMYTDEDSPLLVNGMPVTSDASEMDKQMQVLHLADEGQVDVMETEDTISAKKIASSFTTDSFSNWLLYLDESLASIDVVTGDSITLRPYSSWIWKQEDETDYAGVSWTFPSSEGWTTTTQNGYTYYTHTNGSQFRSFQKTDDQLNETYTVVTSVTLNAGTFNLRTTKGKTIQVNVTQGASSPKPKTVVGIDGLKVNLFDYDVPNQKRPNGQNIPGTFDFKHSGGLDVESNVASNPNSNNNINTDHDLKFLGYGGSNSNDARYAINNYTHADPSQGIVKSELGSDGYPELEGYNTTTWYGPYQVTTWNERTNASLKYLFDTTSHTNNVYAFAGADGLFQRDNLGYYYYNSNTNYAEYDRDTNQFVLYEHTYSQNTGGSNGANAKPIGFFPFHEYDTNNTQSSMNFNSNLNHHFGMSMSVDFELPSDKKASGDDGFKRDIIYEFSGDDDMWVFVDDELVLDIGGIHQPVTGTINFTTGVIKVHGKDDVTKTFDVGAHTLKMFYIERGGCDSNLSVRFNLPLIIGRGNIRIAKKDAVNENSYLSGAVFGIWENPDCSGEPYTIATSDRNGIIFKNLPVREEGQKYYLQEIMPPEGYLLDKTIYILTENGKNSNGEHTFAISTNGQLSLDIDGRLGYPIIRNQENKPISVTVHKTWEYADGTEMGTVPEDKTATFELKRYRTYTTDPFLTVNLVSDNPSVGQLDTISAYPNDVLTIEYKHAPNGNSASCSTSSGVQNVLTLPTNATGDKISVTYTVNASHAVDGVIDIVVPKAFTDLCDGSIYDGGENPKFENIHMGTHNTTRDLDPDYGVDVELPYQGEWAKTLSQLTVQEKKEDGIIYHYEYFVVEKDIPDGFEAIFYDENGKPLPGNPGQPNSGQPTSTGGTQEVVNRELLDVPIQKHWADFSGDAYTWTAVFQLDAMDVKVNASDENAPTDEVRSVFTDVPGRKLTVSKGQTPTPMFTDLPMYKVMSNGTVYRVLYSVKEIGYTVSRLNGTVVAQWGVDENGGTLQVIGDQRFEPQFEQDAGEHGGTIGDYVIKIVNVLKDYHLSKEIDLTITKRWPEGSTLGSSDDTYATFVLKRYKQVEHRDYSTYGTDTEWVTITLETGTLDDPKTQTVTVPKDYKVHIVGNIKGSTNANPIRFTQQSEEGDTLEPIELIQNNASADQLPFEIEVVADQTKTITLANGDNFVVGGRDGFRLTDYRNKDEIVEDTDYSEEFTLNNANNWTTTYDYLPQIEEEKIDPKTGSQKIVVYSYYIEETGSNPADFHPVFKDSNGTPITIGPNNRIENSMSITAENVQELTNVTLKKVTKDQVNVDGAPTLKGAAFDIKKYADENYQELDTTWGTQGVKSMRDVNNNGLFEFTGLPAGYYKIVETAWPDGHVKLSEDPIFKVVWNSETKQLEVVLLNPNGTEATNNTTDMVRVNDFTIIVGNEPGVELPAAGGSGTTTLTAFGIALFVVGAMLVMVRRKRMAQ